MAKVQRADIGTCITNKVWMIQVAPSEHHILLNYSATTTIKNTPVNVQTKNPLNMFHTSLRIIGVLSRNTDLTILIQF